MVKNRSPIQNPRLFEIGFDGVVSGCGTMIEYGDKTNFKQSWILNICPAPPTAQKGQMPVLAQPIKCLYGTFRDFVIPVPQCPVNIKK